MDHWKTTAPITHAETAKGGRQFVWGMVLFLASIPVALVVLRTWVYPWVEAREKAAEFEGGPERSFTLNISGMECAMCAVHIEETLGKLPGVKSVKADDQTGTCTIVTRAKDTGLLAASIAESLAATNKYAVVDAPQTAPDPAPRAADSAAPAVNAPNAGSETPTPAEVAQPPAVSPPSPAPSR